jgi:UDPglucose 6-dehydrogenase
MIPDRIVCWIESENAKKTMEEIYDPFVKWKTTLLFTDIKSSEIIKYWANAFLATKITFANMLSRLAEVTGADIWHITKGIWLDERIGPKFLHAGIWYGWSCFPKDIDALIETMNDYWIDNDLLKAVETLNESQKTIIIDKLLKYYPDLSWKTISIWGLSFKPKTDDIRKAPSIEIINKLLELGVKTIKVYDPEAMENIEKYFKWNKKIVFSEKSYDSLKKSDALLLLTEWNEFRWVDFDKIRETMSWNIILDGRNVWKREMVESKWFVYEGIGR